MLKCDDRSKNVSKITIYCGFSVYSLPKIKYNYFVGIRRRLGEDGPVLIDKGLMRKMNEREKYRRIQTEKRRRQVRCQRIIMAFLMLFVIGGTIFCNIPRGEDKKVTDATKNGKAAQVEGVELNSNRRTVENSAADANDPRMDFAVDPARPVGSDQQTEEKIMYLTFDDGPSPLTRQVLDILDQYNAKATFFVSNQDSEYVDMIKEAYDRGHTIGMHTSTHDYSTVYASVDAYFADLDAIAQTVKSQIGYVPCFIRFPGGSSNTASVSVSPGIMSVLVQEVQNRGYQYYDWNGSIGDGAVRSKEELIAGGTTYKDNNIVYLVHDSASKQTTVEALPTIMEHYQAQGYEFRALDRESYTAHHGVNN